MPKGYPGSGNSRSREYINEYCRQKHVEFKAWISDIKESSQCIDCPPDAWWPACALDFDHVRGVKRFSISDGSTIRRARAVVQEEIDKCEVVCSNHHRMRTAARPHLGRQRVS